MKILAIVRHGKSDWETPAGDFHRPLLERGISDIKKIAKEYEPKLPDNFIIYSSTALRASQSARNFAESVGFPSENIIYDDALYTFNSNELENLIKSFDDNYNTAMVFGHNEAITDFVNKFGNIFIDNVPTSGLVTLTFEATSWKKIDSGTTGPVVFPRNI